MGGGNFVRSAWPCKRALGCVHSQCMLKSYAVQEKDLGADMVQGLLMARLCYLALGACEANIVSRFCRIANLLK